VLRNPDQTIRPAKTTFLLNALAASMLMTQHAYALAPDAGKQIENTAMASYTFEGSVLTQPSNTVAVDVSALYAISLTPAAQQIVEAGDAVTWLNQLQNLSNTSANVQLSAVIPTGLGAVRIYLDNNRNGLIDADDRLLDLVSGDVIPLQRGEAVQLIVTSVTGSNLNAGEERDLPLSATIREDLSVPAVDAVNPLIIVAPELVAIKSVDRETVDSSTDKNLKLSYLLNVESRGTTAVRPTTLQVDGQSLTAVFVRDPLPANTKFLDVRPEQADAIVVYKTKDEPSRLSTQRPTDLASIDEVIVAYPNGIAAGSTQRIALDVEMFDYVASTGARLVNRFQVEYQSPTVTRQKTSNDAVTRVTQNVTLPTTSVIANYSGNYQKTLNTGSAGNPLHIQAFSTSCNSNRNEIERVNIQIKSRKTGDIIDVIGVETEANSGIFRYELPTKFNEQAVAGDLDLQVVRRDTAEITLMSCLDANGVSGPPIGITTNVLIDPFGIVFDAETGLPVRGATVTLVDAATNLPVGAGVAFTLNEATGALEPMSAVQVTNDAGEFIYPLVVAGDYKLLVDTSTITGAIRYSFVSDKARFPVASFPADKLVDAEFSYAGAFSLREGDPALNVDIPIDPAPRSPATLFVKKDVSSSNLEIGDFADYTVIVRNQGELPATDVAMVDTLPIGFTYVPNTTRVSYTVSGVKQDIVRVADPAGGKGRYLTLGLDSLPPKAEAKVTYRVHIGANALTGDGINRVHANAVTNGAQITSNQAQAKVNVSAGVFMSEALIIGKVYADCNRNGMQDSGERGVPGVRLYLEDGSFVVTDSEGKYSFYGISAKTHVLKLDRTSLPADVELVEQSNRNAGDPGSRFVDLKRGELHRADFALTDGMSTCSTGLNEQIENRRQLIGDQNTDIERVLRSELAIEENYRLGDVRGLPASGCISTDSSANCNVSMPNQPTSVLTDLRTVRVDKVIAPVMVDLEDTLRTAESNNLTILNLTDGQILPFPQTNLQVKAVANTTVEVLLNGKAVSDDRVGKRAVLADRQIAGLDYIGLTLAVGQNVIEVRQLDQMGNLRDRKKITVIAPDAMSRIEVQTSEKLLEANGRDVVNVVVSIVDKNGVPVASRTPITLDSNLGKIQLEDLDPNSAGIQQFIEGGRLLVPVLAPAQAGEGRLEVTSGIHKAELPLRFVPELRPMIAAGIVEGTVSLTDFDPKQLGAVSRNDGFEQELRELSSSNDGKLQTTGRAAFFLKGKVKGEYLLTMAYDSDKDSKNERLFRDIRPEEYYPVYGDASAKGFDAQSTSKLYVRLDRGRSYAMYGDINTRVENDEGLSLGQYSRTLTGVKGHYETDRVAVTSFAAQTSSRQIVSEQRGLGISGPYLLDNVPIDSLRENSEKVERIVRDRDNPGLIIKRETLQRFADYEIDTFTNGIMLNQALPSLDENLNPISLRVTVESDEGGEEYVVGGVAGRVKLNEQLHVGGSYVKNDDPLTDDELASVNAVVKLSDRAKLVAEIARSINTVDPANLINSISASASPTGEQSGTAGRIELNYKIANTEARVYHHQADAGFYNAASPISAGRKESGVKVQSRIAQVGLARAEAIRTEDSANDGVRDGFSVSIERALNQYLSLEVGARTYRETTQPASESSEGATATDGTTVRSKLNALLPWVEGSSAFVEYEQDIDDAERKVLALGGSYQMGAKGRVYARHELMSSLSGAYGLNEATERNSTVIGVDSNYMKDGTVFSEYRLRDGIGAREAEAAIGLRNRWHVGNGIRLNTGFERVETLKAGTTGTTQDATAISLGVEYLTDPRWKGVAKVETRWSDRSDSYLNTLGVAYKASDDVTLLAKNVYRLIDNKEGGDRTVDRFQVGAAYRDFDSNRFDALTKFEYRLDDNQTNAASAYKREAFIVSAHTNYHPVRRFTLASQYAAKYARQNFNDLTSTGVTQLVAGRAIYDINERWDTSLNVGVMWDDQSSGVRHLLGAEVGYLVAANLWVSGGYNIFGYRDDDLTDANTTVKGAYMRLRFKFDEDLFKMGVPVVNKSMEPQQ